MSWIIFPLMSATHRCVFRLVHASTQEWGELSRYIFHKTSVLVSYWNRGVVIQRQIYIIFF